MSAEILPERTKIRRAMRHIRQTLTPEQQTIAAHRLTERVLSYTPVSEAHDIALFLSVDGEINTHPLIDKFWQQKKRLWLPVLHPFSPGNLLFLRYTPTTPLIRNRLNILQPPLDVRQLITLDKLDIMIVPLVAFDKTGQRLGMGGGFYDRTLRHWQRYHFLPIGIAHDCQQVKILPAAVWDIPLPVIITPAMLWQW